MVNAAPRQTPHYFAWTAGKQLAYGAIGCIEFRKCSAENDDRFGSIRPLLKCQHGLIGLSANNQGVYRGHEFVISVWLAAVVRQPIQATVFPGNEAVEACRDEHRCFHLSGRVIML